MLLKTLANFMKSKYTPCMNCGARILHQRLYSNELESRYTDDQKEKILEVMNNPDEKLLSGYEITKGRLKNISQWKNNNGHVKTISEVELVEGFSGKTAKKLFDSIIEGPPKVVEKVSRIKGQVLQPTLTEAVRTNCKTVLSVYVTVNSVCCTLIDRRNYEVTEWTYHSIDYPEGKRFQITDILDIAWKVTQNLPAADIFVMKAEATTLRAAGSDPNNPKVIAVNLQKAQLVAMIVALINARSYNDSVLNEDGEACDKTFSQKVYFLRPTLPFRLYGTLIGNEKVTTDQTVEMLLQNANERSPNNSHVFMSESLMSMFRSQNDLQKDMLGHSLLLGLTFMDVCIYRNQDSINKLLKRGE